MCPDTYTVRAIVKYNLVIIDRIPAHRSNYRTLIVSALLLTATIFKVYWVVTQGQ